jgi:hypothetical protein
MAQMTEPEYMEFRQLCEQRRDSRIERATKDFARDMKAVDRLWRLKNNSDPPTARLSKLAVKIDVPAVAARMEMVLDRIPGFLPNLVKPISVKAAVRDAAREFTTPYTHRDVERKILPKIGMRPKRRTVIAALRNLEEENFIKVFERGRGRRPTKYAPPEILNGKH